MLDINVSFATETKGFWEHYWNSDKTLFAGSPDPDKKCKLLRLYHQQIWSRDLPCGKRMELELAPSMEDYLLWNGLRFGSDHIATSFRYKKNANVLEAVQKRIENFDTWMYECLKRLYTIGGMMIFPKHKDSTNQCRGVNPYICDRFDLTLECIRLYYAGVIENDRNPLADCLVRDKTFFDLFVNFRGFVDFFFLNDIVDKRGRVRFWLPVDGWKKNPLPRDDGEYLLWMERVMEFVDHRNESIFLLRLCLPRREARAL